VTEQDVQHVQEGLAAVKIHDSELGKLQEKQRAAVQRSISRTGSMSTDLQFRGNGRDTGGYGGQVYSDLQDLNFGPLGSEQRALPPPLRPSAPRSTSDDDSGRRGSLSDFSDYQSSDEEMHNHAHPSSSRARAYVDVSDNEEDVRHDIKQAVPEEEDPFADPFAD